MNRLRTKQGGSVASFIVIGVILLSGLVGVMYFMNQRGEQARREQSIAEAESEASNKKPIKSSEPDELKPESVNDSEVSIDSSDVTHVEHINSEVLPTTGPELSFMELITIYLLTSTLTAYLISRHKLTYSL